MPMAQPGAPPAVSAPPSGQPGGAVMSQGGPETTGTLPPTGGAGAIDGNVIAQGILASGREKMRTLMRELNAMRVAFGMVDPESNESKALETMFRAGIKHFSPSRADEGKTPQMAPPQPAQGPPQMAGPGPMPQPPTGPIPSLAGANI